MNTAKISEVFFSLQGEGPYLGTAQVFIRFSGCNIKCDYCDTLSGKSRVYDAACLREKVKALLRKHKARYISLTGGEPLLQADFIRVFLEGVKVKKELVYLETNGILYKNFTLLRDCVDVVSMDIKLPSATGTGEFWSEHALFLRACTGKNVFVKAVITLNTLLADVTKAAALVSKVDRKTLFVLQLNQNELGSSLIAKALKLREAACVYLDDVRIMPQVHNVLEIK